MEGGQPCAAQGEARRAQELQDAGPGGRAGPELWKGLPGPAAQLPRRPGGAKRKRDLGREGSETRGKHLRKLGGDVRRRALGGGKGGIFLFFILYCSEVTEFILYTSNVSIKKTTTVTAETKQPPNRKRLIGTAPPVQPGEAWLRVLGPEPTGSSDAGWSGGALPERGCQRAVGTL